MLPGFFGENSDKVAGLSLLTTYLGGMPLGCSGKLELKETRGLQRLHECGMANTEYDHVSWPVGFDEHAAIY